MGWWIAFAILFLLAILPLGIRIRYDSEGFLLRVLIGPVRITVFPLPAWMKKRPGKPSKKKSEKKESTQKPSAPAEKQGGSLSRFLPFVKLGVKFINDFRRKIRMDHLVLKLVLAGNDPCDLAVNYGRTWAAVGNMLTGLERVFVIKNREIDVQCDFTASETIILFSMDITITLGRVLGLLCVYAYRFLKEFIKMKKNKAVQEK